MDSLFVLIKIVRMMILTLYVCIYTMALSYVAQFWNEILHT